MQAVCTSVALDQNGAIHTECGSTAFGAGSSTDAVRPVLAESEREMRREQISAVRYVLMEQFLETVSNCLILKTFNEARSNTGKSVTGNTVYSVWIV